MNSTKSLFASKTFWIAVAQAVIGTLVIFSDSFPNWAGELLLIKSLIDVVLRSLTTQPISV